MPKAKKDKPKRLILLDAHAILHRAYHALPDFSSPKGEPTGALYGVSAMLTKIIVDLKPDYIVACYDLPGPTFRHEAYEEYKAGRVKTDDSLIQQINRSRDIFEAFGIPVYEKAGFEADDILGTIVEQMGSMLKKGELEILIASGDMDTMQLIDKKAVQVYTLKRGINDTILYDETAMKKRFGFKPALLTDYKGLRGDPSDNIIGIVGIGEKTATALIQAFGTIEEIYTKLKKNEDSFIQKGITPRIINLLKEGEEEALFSKTLATIRRDVPIKFSLPTMEWREAFLIERVTTLFRELGFRTLTTRVEKLFGKEEKDDTATEEKDVEGTRAFKEAALALWILDSNITNPTIEDVLGFSGGKSLSRAHKELFIELKKKKLEKVYYDIEEPIIDLLDDAQRRGITIDTKVLTVLSKRYHTEVEKIIKRIYKASGEEFNISSPKQLSEVLFLKLGLPTKGLKKTPGGVISTRESELLKLKDEHIIIEDILHYRELQKLLTTYVDNIPDMLDRDSVLHPTLLQSGTTTGRMASVNPNIQNIPNKGDHGKEIRRAFVAREGFTLGAFDYSQIEFRILALLSKDKDLIDIFKRGHDFHERVASEVFGVKPQDVTKDMRRRAKVINFGILYGMGITSLQKSLGSTRADAQRFYDTYFDEFPGVARYIETIKKEAHIKGYTETLFGRRRYIQGLSSHIPYIRAAAERMALNAPIQGTATGDVIKIAIKKVDDVIKKNKLDDKVFLLFQVHDELVYEIDTSVVKKAAPLIKEAMENVIHSTVPLIVDVSLGDTWGDL